MGTMLCAPIAGAFAECRDYPRARDLLPGDTVALPLT
jgi:hypothetical protein